MIHEYMTSLPITPKKTINLNEKLKKFMLLPLELSRSIITIFTLNRNIIHMQSTRGWYKVHSLKCNPLGCVHYM